MEILKSFVFPLIFLCGVSTAWSQAQLKKADKEYELKAYNLAIPSYLKYLEKAPKDVESIRRLADSYRHINQLKEAIKYYELALELKGITPQLIYDYAQSLKSAGQYEKAKIWFLNYAEGNPDVGNHYAESCDFARYRKDLPAQYQVNSFPGNTAGSDFGPVFFRDKVIFSSTRKDAKRDLDKPSVDWAGNAYNQLFVSPLNNPGSAQLLLNDIKNNYNIGPLAYSANGKVVAYSKNNFTEGTRQTLSSGLQLSLYIAEADGNGSWINEKAFPYNSESYSNGYPSLSGDGSTLYFASDRPDGFGGYDLFVSRRMGDTWSLPENLGPLVNTPGNEITPYFDGQSLYFSSDWHTGFGGMDIFRAEQQQGKWNKVYHLGSQINSSRDDYGFIYDGTKNTGFFTSNRIGGKGFEDIYQIKKLTDKIVISVSDQVNNLALSDALIDFSACGERSFKTDEKGTYSFNALPGLNCMVSVQKEGFAPQTFSLVTNGQGGQKFEFEVKMAQIGLPAAVSPVVYHGKLVDDQTKAGIGKALIRATNQKSGEKLETYSGEDGRFTLPLKANDTYILYFSKAGLKDLNKMLNTSNVTATDLGVLNLQPSSTALAVAKTPEEPAPEANINKPPLNTTAEVSQEKTPKPAAGYETGEENEVFAIQVAAVINKPSVDIGKYHDELNGIGKVYKRTQGEVTRIRLGLFNSRTEAIDFLTKVKQMGYQNAFVVKEDKDNTLQQLFLEKPASSPVSPSSTNDLAASRPPDESKPATKTEIVPPAQSFKASIYKVRLASYRNPDNFNREKVVGIGTLERYDWNGYAIMVLGGYASRADAEAAVSKVQAAGFPEAHLITHQNGRLRRVRD